jgi:tetratricopeptide (TPR) repeat protein
VLGKSVGPYQILERLGGGGMGEVFLGHDPRLERRVALKCLRPSLSISEDAHLRVLREARAIARLTHPHIAGVYDVLEQDGQAFIVMEYVEGVSLATHMASGPLPPSEVKSIGRQLASALSAAHAQGVVHRDLKPANIQVMRDGSIKVLDFGVARLMAPPSTIVDTTIVDHVIEPSLGGNPGTPLYMAPEQLSGHPADARTDIYSAGVILFQMATGRRPYLDSTAVRLALAMNADPAPAARSINPMVPQELSDAIAKALKRHPDNRYQNARELDAALAAMSGTASSTRSITEAAQRARDLRDSADAKRRRIWIAAAVVAVLTLAVAWGPLLKKLGLSRSAPAAIGRAVMAVLPVDNPSGDLQADYLGAGIASVVVGNLGSIPGLTVLSRASTAPYENRRNDLTAMRREIGADYVLDLVMKSLSPRAELIARLRNAETGMVAWEQTIGGDPLTVEQTLLDSLAQVLERDALGRRLTGTEFARVHKVPTKSGEALLAYSEARALLGPSGSAPATARAVTLLQQAIAKDPQFALAHAALGDAYWEMYQRDKKPDLVSKATAAVNEALRIDSEQAPVYYSLGNMYQLTGRYEDAVKALRRAIAIQPDSDESHGLLARVLAAKADYPGAAAEAQRAVDVRANWNNYFIQGRVAYLAGHLDQALTAFRKTTELNPAFAGGYQMLGTTYQMQGDLDSAIGNYEHSIRLAPNAPAYSNLAIAYLRAKRYPQAIAAFSEALNRDPQNASRHRNLADAYKAAGLGKEAREQYAKALTLARTELAVNPRDVITIALLALCEANLGQRLEAERHAAEAAALGPTNAELRFRLAKVYTLLNDRAAALATLRAAVAAGYEPTAAKEDDELTALHGGEFDAALASGLAARAPAAGAQRK